MLCCIFLFCQTRKRHIRAAQRIAVGLRRTIPKTSTSRCVWRVLEAKQSENKTRLVFFFASPRIPGEPHNCRKGDVRVSVRESGDSRTHPAHVDDACSKSFDFGMSLRAKFRSARLPVCSLKKKSLLLPHVQMSEEEFNRLGMIIKVCICNSSSCKFFKGRKSTRERRLFFFGGRG